MSDEYIEHIGTPRHSGRYPWGSGENPNQRGKQFLDQVAYLKKKGMSDTEIAAGFGMNTSQLRARKAVERARLREAQATMANMLKDKGMSNVAIAEKMGLPSESSVRLLLDPAARARNDVLMSTANMLKDRLDEANKDGNVAYLDIGAGVENHIGVSNTKLKNAVAILEDQGYTVHTVQVDQQGTSAGNKTSIKVLAPPGTEYRDIAKNQDKIQQVKAYTEDEGRTFKSIQPPVSVSSKRVEVRYGDEGGSQMDGVIQLRRGVDDISLGASRYAQVRIKIDDSHYLKGMAMYADDLPDGVDIRFNTNKSNTGNKLDAMKGLKDDPDLPFGSVVRQKTYEKDGKSFLSALNIVGSENPDGQSTSGEEGGWNQWSAKLSSQMLSKQSPTLAKQQLDLTYKIKQDELDEILQLTNPAVKKRLLESFADGADSSAVQLKAAGLPRTAAHVILPINTLKDNEIYAPKYNNGEKVVLIRHPHGGKFEIPELVVNNRNKEANSLIKNAKDAVGINSKVAERLSGADFDGDTVLVIPNNRGLVKTEPALAQLKNFDPKSEYKAYDGMPTIDGGIYRAATGKVDYQGKRPSGKLKQTEMGKVSNLITDMTIKGATNAEIARAVKHSMVVIDAEKHVLNWKQSAEDNNIKELKAKYQGGANKGASTIVSRASSELRIPQQELRKAKSGGPIDRETGELVWVPTGKGYTDKATGKWVDKKTITTKMANAKDASKLTSAYDKDGKRVGVEQPIEKIYADHANSLKALANKARREMVNTKSVSYSPSAKIAYDPQVKSLTAKLQLAQRNAPLERQAQLIASTVVKAKQQANPEMSKDELKKVKSLALQEARIRTGAHKQRVNITPDEWQAIQAGAITQNRLSEILRHADLDQVKAYATPRATTTMTSSKIARAKSMLASGYTQAEIADALGVSTSTLDKALG